MMTESARETREIRESSPDAGTWTPGRLACFTVRHQGRPLRLYGNALEGGAVRVQRGFPELHGLKLGPGEFTFCWWADDEQD